MAGGGGRWKSVADWQREPAQSIGPMVAPAIWKPGTSSRCGDMVELAAFTVLDFDGFDGSKPETPGEITEHLRAFIALVRCLREALEWKLAALLFTGSKSLHAWFHTPSAAAIQSLKDTATVLGLDAGLIGRPEHPCRLPGWTHPKTGEMSHLIWLQRQIGNV